MNDGKTLIEELKWIKRELNDLKIAHASSAVVTKESVSEAPSTANSSTVNEPMAAGPSIEEAVAEKATELVITKDVELEMPAGYEDSQFTINITPVEPETDTEESPAKVQITVTSMKDFSVSVDNSGE